MNNRLVIFDLDGTLVDSRQTIFRAMTEGARAIGLSPPDYQAVRQIVGLSLKVAIAQMCPDLSVHWVDRYYDSYRQAHLKIQAETGWHDSLYEGIQTCLDELRAAQFRLGMATGNSRRGVDRAIATYGWEGLFDSFYCADDSPSKPDPHMVSAQLADHGFAPHQAVVIGDTSHDIRMAHAAHVRAIAVTWGFHEPGALMAESPEKIIDNVGDLHNCITTALSSDYNNLLAKDMKDASKSTISERAG